MEPVSGIFMSYRRQDTAPYAGRLTQDLRRLGADVFYDVANVAPGADFSAVLRSALSSAAVVLVLIGREWLSATDAHGRRRIDDDNDFIRTEIAAALQQDKPVVPVLVGGAHMPPGEALPHGLKRLAERNAFELRDDHWEQDVERMAEALRGSLGLRARRAPAVAEDTRPPQFGERAGTTRAPFLTRLRQAIAMLRGQAPAVERSAAAPVPQAAHSSATVARVTQAARRSHQVFVSYSSKDSARVDRIVGALEDRGKVCWMAPRDIPPGAPSWAEPIVTAIASSKLVLVLLTEHSIPSLEVLREVTLGADEKVPLLGVSLDATKLSPGLRYYFVAGQRLDVAQFDIDGQVRSILPAVEQQLPAGIPRG
jgi:hypothetical protein